jgi:serine protease Do
VCDQWRKKQSEKSFSQSGSAQMNRKEFVNRYLLFSVGIQLLIICLLFLGSCQLGTRDSSGQTSTGAAEYVRSANIGSYADVVSRVAPSVVTIRSERRVRAPQQHPFFDDPFFWEFFGRRFGREMPQPQERVQRGLGSGVIFKPDGYILTNHHVVDGAEGIKVEMSDQRVFNARIVGSDPPSDLAVLKIDTSGLPALTMGDSDRARVGDIVLAVGNPLGIGQTVTAGIISAKGRATGLSDGSFESFLQTDAPINRGNSGGALINTAGELVGINSQILSPTGVNIGIGFAIPVNMARNVTDQLISTGRVRRGKLGVTIQPITSDLAASLGLSEVRGVIVSGVESGGPADSAGIKQGDVITAINGKPVEDSNSLRNQIASTQPGAEVTLTVRRESMEQQIRVKLGELSVEASQAGSNRSEGGGSGGLYGMTVSSLNPETARRLGMPESTRGMVVTSVEPISSAADAGLQPGDVITEVNREPVSSVAELKSALAQTKERPALLLISRRGATLYLTMRHER